ncbi:Aldehyde/histidinol dehydrogenase [Globomyces pollinis-pini]|nr:Aldehyde/histidinol dehydrogenase [Globomyces pollinis-pini]
MNATNFINNSFAPLPNQSIDIISPASNKVIGKVALSSPDQVDAAVQAAHNAFLSWSSLTVKSRIQYLIRFHQLVIKHKDELADLIVLEHGKTKEEALAEVAKGNETVEFALSLPQIYLGTHLEVSRGVHCQDVRRPHGVVVSIVPFNFPFMVPMWTLPIAIAAGNTFVLKPSEKVPLTMGFTMKLIQEAGFPEGVVNIVHGTASVVQQLCDHPKVKAVTFVGTSHVAELLSHRCRLLNKRVLCLGGAKNHLVASPDCDIDMASSDIVASFSGCSGQRCMAASVLLTIGSQPKLLEAIVKKAEALGPAQSGKNIGPVIDAISRDKIVRYIEESEKGGAKILLDGRKWITRDDLKASGGFWVGPTVILHTNKKDSALHDEIFGPVISIYECSTKEEAIEIENANPYGNAACIYTNQGAIAEWYTKRFSAGMLGVNIGVPVPREPFSFGGINRSNFGDFDITGLGGLEFFTHHRKITTKWTPPKEASWMS